MGITVTWKKRNSLPAYALQIDEASDILVDSIAQRVRKSARQRIIDDERIETGAMRASMYVVTPKLDDYEECAGEAESLAKSRSVISDFYPGAETRIMEKVTITGKHQAIVGSAVHYAIHQHEGFVMTMANNHYVPGIFFLEAAAQFAFTNEAAWNVDGFK